MSLADFLSYSASHDTRYSEERPAPGPLWTKSALDARFGTDQAMGVIYDPSAHDGAGGSVFRDSDGLDAICCTHYALQVQKALPENQVRVVGFAAEDNPDCAVSKEQWHEGHDFALVDQRWLIDPWARLVECTRKQIVYDLHDPEDRALALATYGNPEHWVEVYGIDGSLSHFSKTWDRSGLEAMRFPIQENSLGHPIADSPEALAEFWKQCAGRILVDEAGRPLVLYHGTNTDFDTFQIKGQGKTADAGVFFTENRDVALTYGEKLRAIYLLLEPDQVATVDFRGNHWNNGPCDFTVYDAEGYAVETYDTLDEAMRYKEADQTIIPQPLILTQEGTLEPDLLPNDSDDRGYSTDDFAAQARRLGFAAIVFNQVIDSHVNDKKAQVPTTVYCVMDPTRILDLGLEATPAPALLPFRKP